MAVAVSTSDRLTIPSTSSEKKQRKRTYPVDLPRAVPVMDPVLISLLEPALVEPPDGVSMAVLEPKVASCSSPSLS